MKTAESRPCARVEHDAIRIDARKYESRAGNLGNGIVDDDRE